MYLFNNAQLHSMALHRVGNKNRGESNFESEELMDFGAALKETLQQYFFKPFKKTTDSYQFVHASNLDFNELYNFAQSIFDDPTNRLLPESKHILYHLYKQSTHSNIKSGELFVGYFTHIQLDDELLEGIGIFKSEVKHPFLSISKAEQQLMLTKGDGISLNKLDKGALILNTDKADGFRVLSIDNNHYDANYWLHNFLNVDNVKDENYHTKVYLQLCDDFSKDVIAPQADKQEQMKFLTDSVDYFASNEKFNFNDFTNEIAPLKDYGDQFRQYQQDYNLLEVDDFPISQTALKTTASKFKSLIKLDTGIQIKLDLKKHPEAPKQYLEKAYDEEKQMHYYKVYFNDEYE